MRKPDWHRPDGFCSYFNPRRHPQPSAQPSLRRLSRTACPACSGIAMSAWYSLSSPSGRSACEWNFRWWCGIFSPNFWGGRFRRSWGYPSPWPPLPGPPQRHQTVAFWLDFKLAKVTTTHPASGPWNPPRNVARVSLARLRSATTRCYASANRQSRPATYRAVCGRRATLLGNVDRADRKPRCGRNWPSGWMLSVQMFGPGGTWSIFWTDGRRTRAAAKAPQRKRPCRSRATARRS